MRDAEEEGGAEKNRAREQLQTVRGLEGCCCERRKEDDVERKRTADQGMQQRGSTTGARPCRAAPSSSAC